MSSEAFVYHQLQFNLQLGDYQMKILQNIFAPLFAVLVLTFAYTAFAPARAQAQTSYCGVSGYVYDGDSVTPMQGFKITISYPGFSQDFYTDYHGLYQAVIPAPSGTLHITAVSYNPTKYWISPSDEQKMACPAGQVIYPQAFLRYARY